MKNFNPFKKLTIGILLLTAFFSLFYGLDGADGLYNMKKSVNSFLLGYMSESWAGVFSALICLPVPVFMVYAAVSGAYRTFTFNKNLPIFDNKYGAGAIVVRGHENYPNINSVLSYRESKMCGMSNEKAAELYIASSKVETLYSGYHNGPETMKTLSYIESKLASMGPEQGLNYLSNKL